VRHLSSDAAEGLHNKKWLSWGCGPAWLRIPSRNSNSSAWVRQPPRCAESASESLPT